MRKKINPEALMRLCIVFGLSTMLLILLISGRVLEYVNPRMNVYLWIAAFSLAGAGFCMLPRLFRPKHHPRIVPYVVVLAIMFGSFGLPSAAVVNTTISFSSIASAKPAGQAVTKPIAAPTLTPPNTAGEQTSAADQDDGAVPDDLISVTDNGFGEWFFDMNANPKNYDGKTVRVKGQVLREQGLADNEFIPARMNMICCVADLMPIGFLCQYDNAKQFTDNEWVWVTATVHIEEYKGKRMPVLKATNVIQAPPPINEYVYLF